MFDLSKKPIKINSKNNLRQIYNLLGYIYL